MTTHSPATRAASRRLWWSYAPATLIITLLSSITFLVPGLATRLQFDVQQFIGGQWWRVITGHCVHYSLSHLFWDLSVFAVLGIICEFRDRRATWLILAATSLLIPLLSVQFAGVEVYRGLSGLDTALFAYLAVSWLIGSLKQRDWMAGIMFGSLIVAMVAKITWELLGNGSLFVDESSSGFTPVPLAHLVGALTGIVVAARALRPSSQPATMPSFGRVSGT